MGRCGPARRDTRDAVGNLQHLRNGRSLSADQTGNSPDIGRAAFFLRRERSTPSVPLHAREFVSLDRAFRFKNLGRSSVFLKRFLTRRDSSPRFGRFVIDLSPFVLGCRWQPCCFLLRLVLDAEEVRGTVKETRTGSRKDRGGLMVRCGFVFSALVTSWPLPCSEKHRVF